MDERLGGGRVDGLGARPTLRFTNDGTFTVVVFADVQDSWPTNPLTLEAMETVIEMERPDLVVLAGDNAPNAPVTPEEFGQYLTAVVGPMERRGVPWCHVYGNHDEEGAGLTKGQQQALYEAQPHCLSQAGPPEVDGVGNYVVLVYPSARPATPPEAAGGQPESPSLAIWALDAHAYMADNNAWYAAESHRDLRAEAALPVGLQGSDRYDFVKFSQLMWYHRTSRELEALAGRRVPGLMVLHVPLPEFRLVPGNPVATGMVGEANEEPSNSPINSGLFAAVLQRGDVRGIFAGHNHNNDYVGTYCGVQLGYLASIGHTAYGLGGDDNDRLRGARVFRVREGTPDRLETCVSHSAPASRLRTSTSPWAGAASSSP